MEPLISLVVALIVVLLLLWCVQRLLGAFAVPEPIGTVIYVLIVLVAVLVDRAPLRGAVMAGRKQEDSPVHGPHRHEA